MKRMLSILLMLMLVPCAALAEEEDEPVTPMHDLTMAHGFRFGGALSYMQLWDANYLNFLKTHCNSITATNEMKAYSLLDQSKSRASSDGMPRMNFSAADKMVAWAQENGLGVRVVLEQERQVKELRCRRERGEVCHGGQYHVQRALLHGLDHGAVIAERRVRVDLNLDLAAGSFGDELSKVVSAFVRRGAVSDHMAERERVARAGVIAVAGRLVVIGLAAAACAEAQCHDKDQYQCSESFFHSFSSFAPQSSASSHV